MIYLRYDVYDNYVYNGDSVNFPNIEISKIDFET